MLYTIRNTLSEFISFDQIQEISILKSFGIFKGKIDVDNIQEGNNNNNQQMKKAFLP